MEQSAQLKQFILCQPYFYKKLLPDNYYHIMAECDIMIEMFRGGVKSDSKFWKERGDMGFGLWPDSMPIPTRIYSKLYCDGRRMVLTVST